MDCPRPLLIDWLLFSGPRHIVTEFQDVGGAGALGEEEGPQAGPPATPPPKEPFIVETGRRESFMV